MSCLIAPGKTRQIRPPDYHFVKCLKEEMLNNPTTDVAPIVALVNLTEGVLRTQKHINTRQLEAIIQGLLFRKLQQKSSQPLLLNTCLHIDWSVYIIILVMRWHNTWLTGTIVQLNILAK